MGKKRTIVTIIAMLILAALVITGFYFLLNKPKSKNETKKTELEKLLEKDIENDYPVTPRETVKLYCKLNKYLYSEEINSEELSSLVKQMRLLFDNEFNENTSEDEQIANLNEERNKNRIILNYIVQKSQNVEYDDTKEYSSLVASFTTKEKNKREKVYERFLLRKDDNGNWKILGWELTNEMAMEDD